MPTSQFSTKQRILEAAETLFARHGFAGASLRQVTSAANVNLAAVNYHFGSKDKLIEEVFRRRLDELNRRRLKALEDLSEDAALEDALAAFIRPGPGTGARGRGRRRLRPGAGAGLRRAQRPVAQVPVGELRPRAQAVRHGVLASMLPDLGREELYWRLDIVAGALTYAMADFGIIQRRAGRQRDNSTASRPSST